MTKAASALGKPPTTLHHRAGVDGARKGGEVSPGNSLVFEAVGPTEGSVEVEVEGGEDAEARGLEYEVRLSRCS